MTLNYDQLSKKHKELLSKEGFVVLDIETTGFSPAKYSKILEISAYRLNSENLEKCESFHTLLNPGKKIPKKIVALTSITDDTIKDSPHFTEVMKDFYDFLSDNIIVAHNASFEKRFLKYAFEKRGIVFNNDFLDTKKVFQELSPNQESYDLDSLCDAFHVTNEHHHRADPDAYITAKIFIELRKQFLHVTGQDVPLSPSSTNYPFVPYKQMGGENVDLTSVNYWHKGDKKFLYVTGRTTEDNLSVNPHYDYVEQMWISPNGLQIDFYQLTESIKEKYNVSSLDDLMQ